MVVSYQGIGVGCGVGAGVGIPVGRGVVGCGVGRGVEGCGVGRGVVVLCPGVRAVVANLWPVPCPSMKIYR